MPRRPPPPRDPFDLEPPRTLDSFCELVLERLAPLEVYARRMFGGHGLYAEDAFFGVIFGDRLYLKTDDDSRRAFEEAGMGPLSASDGTVILKRYLEVPPAVLEAPRELVAWARRAAAAQSPRGARARRASRETKSGVPRTRGRSAAPVTPTGSAGAPEAPRSRRR